MQTHGTARGALSALLQLVVPGSNPGMVNAKFVYKYVYTVEQKYMLFRNFTSKTVGFKLVVQSNLRYVRGVDCISTENNFI